MSEKKTPPPETFGASAEEQIQKKVFISTFSMIAKLASIDGKVSKDEVQIIDRFMKEVLELTPERRKFAIYIFNEARRDSKEFAFYAAQYAELMAEKPKMLEWMLDVLLRVSLVDKEYSGSERHIIEKGREIFKISQERFEEMKARYINSGSASKPVDTENPLGSSSAKAPRATPSAKDDPSSVLRVSPDCSDEELLAAYRKMSIEYGPSRIIELGLPDEFVRLAEQLYAKIQDAYKSLKEDRGLE